MKNEQRRLLFKNGSTTVFTAYEYFQPALDATYLELLEGWDDAPDIEIQTEPAGPRPGSYVTGTHIGEREIVATISVVSDTDVKAVLQSIRSLALNFTKVTLDRIYDDGSGAEKRRESIQGYISSWKWDRKMVHASFAITIKCPDPRYTVYLNGSSTPQSGGII